ncbi:polysaccharide pyruvyl transferase family protein [Cellulomonas xylanilytica]|uniref:Polysaccharide pyruvyl transferase domain-containing protein n=1 Tax=Cellulomonas xylanilytica TaxID=233583 RepID=A0A510V3N6_9CELL|nr:polysaccharide pyruvyl transferase family protein [Cellulomonas xylanilytica]GEK21484.1 hypothetical protein CXY01_20040 [Cellulomonas xylanilytica]
MTVREVGLWATGQDDNIGDSLLRRALVEAVDGSGRLSVFVGPASPGFVSGLGLPDGAVQHASFGAWYRDTLAAVWRSGAVPVLNAGEVPVSRGGAVRVGALFPLLALSRLRGAGGVWVGAGVPVQRRGLRWVYRLAARLCRVVSWRDARTALTMGGGDVVPDLGFALGTSVAAWPADDTRDVLALSLRFDRPLPDARWFAWIEESAAALGLRLVVVSQVARDDGRGAEIAARIEADVEVVPWSSSDHRKQEDLVREVYSRSRLVVSDRLHVLVVACTEGAVPLGAVPSGTGKVRRHFDAAGMPWVGEHDGVPASSLPPLDAALLDVRSVDTRTAVIAARRALAAQRTLLRELLDPGGRR